MYSYWLKTLTDSPIKTLETTLIVRYNDFDNQYKIICDPGGIFNINPSYSLNIEPGLDVVITYCNNVIHTIIRGHKHIFCGYIESITYVNDDMLPKNYYYELHPKKHVRGQKDLLPNTRLLIHTTSSKIILPTKPIVLEYRKGPCKNYYEVI